MEFSSVALGQVIRSLREAQEPALSQEQLGRMAGYRAGAGVSISRVESGMTRPSPDRLAGIARALGATPVHLQEQASSLTGTLNRDPWDTSRVAGDVPETGFRSSAGARWTRVQEVADERAARVQELSDAFDSAHDSARDAFSLTFIDIARQVRGAPESPQPIGPSNVTTNLNPELDAVVEATYRLQIATESIDRALAAGPHLVRASVGLGKAARFTTINATAMLGSASTGAPIAGLTGAARRNAIEALLGGGTEAMGGAGRAGGRLVLNGIALAPAALLAGGVLWAVGRNRRQRPQLSELEAAEAAISATQHGFDAVVDVLRDATGILDYLAVHAGHAVYRWRTDLGPGQWSWTQMTPVQTQHYCDFITLAGCQLSVASINVEQFLTTEGDQLQHHIDVAHAVLASARRIVHALV